jgi:hypothetical protein
MNHEIERRWPGEVRRSPGASRWTVTEIALRDQLYLRVVVHDESGPAEVDVEAVTLLPLNERKVCHYDRPPPSALHRTPAIRSTRSSRRRSPRCPTRNARSLAARAGAPVRPQPQPWPRCNPPGGTGQDPQGLGPIVNYLPHPTEPTPASGGEHRVPARVSPYKHVERHRLRHWPPKPLGLDPPRLVVQVKSGGQVGAPVVSQLQGVMSTHQADQGLLVAWEGLSSQAKNALKNQHLRIRVSPVPQ